MHANVYHHRLKPLDIQDSIDLLTSITVNIDFTANTKETLAELCAGIPLALVIAATLLLDADSYCPKELVDLLDKDRLEAMSKNNYCKEQQVHHVIKSSVDRLRCILKNEYIKLSVIPSSFNADAVAHILELPDNNPALAKQNVLIPLAIRSLVARDVLCDRFDIHDFLREYLSDELSSLPKEQLLSLRNRYCVFLREAAPGYSTSRRRRIV
ncbi:uncharacterized protein [Antedon mediterranea]|uniref:uncharacterized protein n=1 Tax=Antedon mediterranea TaxID=105859 RepID=UPI003AF92695